MGFFHRETLSAIEWRFQDGELAARYPQENLNSSSVIFVQPGQEALFIKEGQICDVLREGRYQLTSENLPLLSRLFNLPFGKNQAFRCYVYFINKEKEVTVLWGTSDPINVVDPRTGLLIRMGARGEYSVKVENSGKFLAKMIGQVRSFFVDDISDFLFSKTIELITSKIADCLQYKGISFTQIASHYREISDDIYAKLRSDALFENYGLGLRTFSIQAINMSDEDFAKIQEKENEYVDIKRKAAAEAEAMRAKGFAEGDVMRNQGVYFDKKRSYDVMEAAAKNESGSNMMNVGMGLGMGLGIGGGFSTAMGQMTNNLGAMNQPAPTITCPKCGVANPSGAKFCANCGQTLQAQQGTPCPNCSQINPSGARFCANCGAPLAPQTVRCECGQENPSGARFCSGCGKKLGGE